MSGVTLVMRHRQYSAILPPTKYHLQAHGLCKGDEHPSHAPPAVDSAKLLQSPVASIRRKVWGPNSRLLKNIRDPTASQFDSIGLTFSITGNVRLAKTKRQLQHGTVCKRT